MNRRRLYRCRQDRRLAGVAAGVAEYLDLDPSLVRVLWVVSIFFGGITILLYIAMALIVPMEPEWGPAGPWQPAGGAWGMGQGQAGMAGQPAAGSPWAASGEPGAPSEPGANPEAGAGAEPVVGQAPAFGADGGVPGAIPGAAPGWAMHGTAPHAGWPAPASHHEPGQRGLGVGATFFGIVLILFGGLAFLQQAVPGWANDGHLLWPAFVLAVGVLLLITSFRRRPREL